ncbi:oleate hydratase [Streptomyces sp. NPDC005047]
MPVSSPWPRLPSITILEKGSLAGGALDGIEEPEKGFVIRGGREMENHFECLWDCFRTIPSLEVEGASVLDGPVHPCDFRPPEAVNLIGVTWG